MPAKRELTMRQMRHVLRLHSTGASAREICRTIGAARSTVQDAIKRAAAAGLSWPLPPELTDAVLEEKLFARAGVGAGKRLRPEPDWAALARELKRPGVNLQILWEEYREDHPAGYRYSRFCDLFRAFERRLSPTMRQRHEPGEKVFVDYSGKKFRSLIRPPAKSARRRFSSACLALRTSPMPRRPGPSSCRTGSPRTCACSASSAACRS